MTEGDTMLHSLRARLIVIVATIFVISMFVLTAVNIWNVRNVTLKNLEDNMSMLSNSYSNTISQWVDAKGVALNVLKNQVHSPTVKVSIESVKAAGGFDDTYIGYHDKRFLALYELKDFDPTSRPWYKDAVAAKKPIVTAPYVDAVTRNLIVSMAIPVFDNEKDADEVAVLGADMQLYNVVNTVTQIKPTPNSYAFIFNSLGLIVTHPAKEWNLKNIKEFMPETTSASLIQLSEDGGSALINVDGNLKQVFVRHIRGTNWYMTVLVDYQESTEPIWKSLEMSLIVASVALLFSLISVTYAITKITKRLAKIKDAIQDIVSGEGDLSRRLGYTGRDELAQIAEAFNRFVEKIAAILKDIRASSESVKISAVEIASGNMDLSVRTESQASSLEKTSTAMEELMSTVNQNADNAKQANQLAMSASEIAIQGGNVMGQVVETMGSISNSSNKIVEIISVIDGIAFQTNILALYAAVEAARAGEQGRGFAVVASEVRNLAQRSATAAKEIKGLIDDSALEVAEGEKLVKRAGETMSQVVSSVKSVTDIVGEISSASQEQSVGIADVGKSITEMDQMTQQNAALVEQSAAAAESLKDQANNLSNTIGIFKLDEQDASTSAQQYPQTAVANLDNNLKKPAVLHKVKPAELNNHDDKAPVVHTIQQTKKIILPKSGSDEWEEH